MVNLEFSTQNADYVSQLGRHDKTYSLEDMVDTDALVIEDCACGKKWLRSSEDYFYFQEKSSQKKEIKPDFAPAQFIKPIIYGKENEIPLFFVDLQLKKFSTMLRELGLNFVPNRLIAPYCHPHTEKVPWLIEQTYSWYNFFLQGPVIECRNAINAHKIEEFVVPLLTERIARRPKLGLIYGLGHIGIKHCLQSKLRRDLTLCNHNKFKFRNYRDFIKSYLNKVNEANYNGSEWEFEEYQIADLSNVEFQSLTALKHQQTKSLANLKKGFLKRLSLKHDLR